MISIKKIPNKGFILACAIIILVPTIAKGIHNLSLNTEYKKHLLIIEGEKPAASNFTDQGSEISKKGNYFGGQALQIDSATPVEGGFTARYELDIPEDGEYKVFVAGTPPGPLSQGSEWHSPYSIALDNSNPVPLTEEGVKNEWPYLFKFSYAPGGYYFTKILSAQFTKGPHTITLSTDQRRRYDGHFTVYLDAFIVVKKDFQPKTNVGRMPKEMFYD